MEKLYHETNNALQQAQNGIGRLERCANEAEAQFELQSLTAQLRDVSASCDRLEIFVSKAPATTRHVARTKLDQLRTDVRAAQLGIEAMFARMAFKWRATAEREELLTQRNNRGPSTALNIGDHELLVHDRLQSSHRGIDDLLNQGAETLGALRSQHLALRGVRRKMLDIGSQLGLSDTTLRMIDRRVREDWLIFLVACVVFCIFMYAFYRFWKG